MRAAPPFRPQSLGSILVTALRLYRSQWWSWMGIVVLCYAPVVGLTKLWQHTHPFAAIASDFERSVLAQGIAQLWWFLGTGTLLTATVVAGLASAYHREAATVGSCYRVGLHRVGVLLAASLLPLGVNLVTHFILLLANELALFMWLRLPLVVLYGSAVWVEAHFLFVPQISVLEQRHPFHVLQRSWYLAHQDIRRTYARLSAVQLRINPRCDSGPGSSRVSHHYLGGRRNECALSSIGLK